MRQHRFKRTTAPAATRVSDVPGVFVRLTRLAIAAALISVVGACQRPQGGGTVETPVSALPPEGTMARIPSGDLAGSAASTLASTASNPYDGNVEAVAQGKVLFIKMNCAGCHGYTAKGGMGPDLTDTYWRYGGTPAAIYKSIYGGRPQGMPAWGSALQPRDLWMLVAYVQSLGGSFPATDYQASLQGDVPGENVAPEAQAASTQTSDAKAAAATATAAMSAGSPPPTLAPPAGSTPAQSTAAPVTPSPPNAASKQ